ncbi:MAG: hypothetical protein HYY24_23370 [Verrucomicrobia bacterium]|nr:hypothetical protein [Verrucomicrobiota bacterium]
MLRVLCWLVLFGGVVAVAAAERRFEFSEANLNQAPPGFRSALTGTGEPPQWRVVLDEVPPALPPLTPDAPKTARRPVLAQLSHDATDEHFPLLIAEGEAYADFTFTTRFKTVVGVKEQMAGVAFRIQDEKNYYVVRASSLGRSLRFYKFVAGQRSPPIGPEVEISSGVWHELRVECRGNQIRCALDGKELIPPLTDNSFPHGKIGFWTKSDSVSYFADARITYTPRETLAKVLVREGLAKHPRLLGLRIYAPTDATSGLRVVAANDESQLGQAGSTVDADVVARDAVGFGRTKKELLVTLPLHDRNGEAVAALRVILKPFPGQTEQNAIARALPIAKGMEGRFRTLRELTE